VTPANKGVARVLLYGSPRTLFHAAGEPALARRGSYSLGEITASAAVRGVETPTHDRTSSVARGFADSHVEQVNNARSTLRFSVTQVVPNLCDRCRRRWRRQPYDWRSLGASCTGRPASVRTSNW